jgi:hypothetical protein
MNAVQSALSSARLNRLLFGLGVAVLAAGVLAVLFAFVGGSDKTSVSPEKGFHARLPAKAVPLKNANGVTVRNYYQLDREIRDTVKEFLATAVSRKRLADSWDVVAPELKKGYTQAAWSHAKSLPIIPYPVADIEKVNYYLDYASTKEVLLEVGVSAKPDAGIRPVTFQLALRPVPKGNKRVWMVDYWMPRWTPPVPQGQ